MGTVGRRRSCRRSWASFFAVSAASSCCPFGSQAWITVGGLQRFQFIISMVDLMSPTTGHVDVAGVLDLGRVDIDLDELHVGVPLACPCRSCSIQFRRAPTSSTTSAVRMARPRHDSGGLRVIVGHAGPWPSTWAGRGCPSCARTPAISSSAWAYAAPLPSDDPGVLGVGQKLHGGLHRRLPESGIMAGAGFVHRVQATALAAYRHPWSAPAWFRRGCPRTRRPDGRTRAMRMARATAQRNVLDVVDAERPPCVNGTA